MQVRTGVTKQMFHDALIIKAALPDVVNEVLEAVDAEILDMETYCTIKDLTTVSVKIAAFGDTTFVIGL